MSSSSASSNMLCAVATLSLLCGGTTLAFTPGPSVRKMDGVRLFSTVASPTAESSVAPVVDSLSLLVDIFESSRRQSPSAADNTNTPPSLAVLLSSMSALESGSDILGSYVNHQSNAGTLRNVSHAVKKYFQTEGAPVGAALTPFAAHCLGASFADLVRRQNPNKDVITICVGRDARASGERLADSFARGAEGLGWSDSGDGRVEVHYADLASTPSMREFSMSGKCDAAVMVMASDLPEDQNGFKFFTAKGGGGFSTSDMRELINGATAECRRWYDLGLMPPSSGFHGVFRSRTVNITKQQ